tara:strand:- start:9140 stop:9424 length:285 start_codon:yes stop_codon:yes gene_type:complete
MGKINTTPLINFIEQRGFMDSWSDTLCETTAEEKKLIVEKKMAKCIGDYKRMMASPKNDGSTDYVQWAVNKVLGIPPKCQFRQSTGRRQNRSLS